MEVYDQPYQQEEGESKTVQPMSIDLNTIQNLSEDSDINNNSQNINTNDDQSDENVKRRKKREKEREERNFDNYVPYTFGSMMNYLCYKEKRKKLLSEIENEQDIFIKYKKFYEIINMQSINEVESGDGIASEYKQKLEMQTKLNLNKEMKK